MKSGLVISLLLLAGCATPAPQIVTRVVDTGCLWGKPVYISKSDVLTDGTAKQILEHNQSWEARCGTKETSK